MNENESPTVNTLETSALPEIDGHRETPDGFEPKGAFYYDARYPSEHAADEHARVGFGNTPQEAIDDLNAMDAPAPASSAPAPAAGSTDTPPAAETPAPAAETPAAESTGTAHSIELKEEIKPTGSPS